MKKILFIDLYCHEHLGGGQKYSRALLLIFKKLNYDITEVCFMNSKSANKINKIQGIKRLILFPKFKKINNIFLKNIYSIFYYIKAKYKINNILNKNKFDIVIDNCTCVCINKKYADKTIFIQHVDESVLFNWKRELIRKILFMRASFWSANTNVVYTPLNEAKFAKYLNKENTIPIMLFANKPKLDINKDCRKKFITYIGRTDDHMKRLDLITKISESLEERIRVIGNNSDFIRSVSNKVLYAGEFDTLDILSKVIPTCKAIIIMSNSEGLSFAAIEGLCGGVPVIVRNTFTNAKFLTDDKKGILIDKNANSNEIIKIIQNIDWKEYNNNAIAKFASEEFCYERFEKKWIDLISKF